MTRLEVVLEVEQVYGGDGVTRMEKTTETKLRRTRKTKQTRSDIGVAAGGGDLTEERVEEVDKDVQTFRLDEKGCPLLRVGGVHGKIWGALKEAAQQLRVLGVEPFTGGYKSIVGMLNVLPIYAPIEMNGSKMETISLPQILNTRGASTMITMRYDVIPKGTLRIVVTCPDQMRKPVEALLRHLENMGLFNKRRGTAKIVSIKEA
jgi:hypothetical protein